MFTRRRGPFNTRVYTTSFGGGGGNRRRTQQHQQHFDPESVSLAAKLIQLVPFLIMLLISLFGSWFTDGGGGDNSNEPSISNLGRFVSLKPDPAYPITRRTVNLDVPYYANTIFQSYFDESQSRHRHSRLVDLEGVVEKVYVRDLQQQCSEETRQRQKDIAGHAKDPVKLATLKTQPLASCEALHNLQKRKQHR